MIAELALPKIENLMRNQVVGRLGCHAHGITYVVPISYAYADGCIYCHSYEGKKIDLMRSNPQVCFQVDSMDDMAHWKSVIAWGDYEELKSQASIQKAYNILMSRNLPIHSSETTHLGGTWPFPDSENATRDGIYFRIRLHTMTGRFEKKTESPVIPG